MLSDVISCVIYISNIVIKLNISRRKKTEEIVLKKLCCHFKRELAMQSTKFLKDRHFNEN